MTTTIEVITPEMAKVYLQKNERNRNIRMREVEALAREMKSGMFRTTHQGIAFDEDGNILDGQHRLTACALSGVPMTVLVTRGLPRSAMEVVDIGVKRQFADRAALVGLYDDDPILRYASTVAFVRKLIVLGYNTNLKVNDGEIVAVINRYRDEVLAVAKSTIRPGNTNAAVGAAALAALICGEPILDVSKFFAVYNNGDVSECFACNVSAAFNLNRQVQDAKIKHLTINNRKLYSMTQNAIWLFLRSGTPVRFIRETKNDRYPVADIVKSILEG